MSDIEFDAFVSTLACVLTEGSLPHNVERNLKGEFWCICTTFVAQNYGSLCKM